MKNTRKKLLVSSVAALLVSAMALSTATFAWFTSSTTAYTKNLSVKTIKASELVISSATSGWDTTVDYATVNKLLLPASTADAKAWYTANAADKTAFTADAKTIKSVTGDNNYYFVDQLNVANAGKANVKNVEITATIEKTTDVTSWDDSYLRIALVETNEKGTGKTPTGTFTENLFVDEVEEYAPIDATGAVSSTKIHGKTTWTVNVGELAGGDADINGAKYYNLYVWFEGQDDDCVDANAGVIIPEIKFTVSGVTAEQTN